VIDRGLLATMALIACAVALMDRRLRRRGAEREPILAMASTPLLVGLLVGRLASVIQDDPATLRRPLDLLLIRGGVEFWPGLAAVVAAIWVTARRNSTGPAAGLAELAPFALWAYAIYEATCLVRDGCFGPMSSAGLRPGGIGRPQVPIGVLVGLSAATLGAAVWRWSRRLGPKRAIGLSVVGIAGIRSIAGFMLPKVTVGLTRPHRESLAVLALGGAGFIALTLRSSVRDLGHRRGPGAVSAPPGRESGGTHYPGAVVE